MQSLCLGFSLSPCFAAMKREVRPSRFQVNSGNPGVPQPKTRRLVFVSPFSLAAEPQQGVLALPAPVRRGARIPASACPHPGLADQLVSARQLEDEERRQLARSWVVCAKRVAVYSSWLRNAGAMSEASMQRVFCDRAPSTLKKRLQGWLRWSSFCDLSNINEATPDLAQISFLESLSIGSLVDRGRERRKSAVATLGAMQFGAWKLGLERLQGLLQSPPVAAWKNADWHQTLKKRSDPTATRYFRCSGKCNCGA